MGAFALRAFDLHLQPLDDDEYASTQAILEIARSGLPHYVPEGVFYTRGPLYHYITAASVWLFGPNLWALRLPSAFFGVATCLLAYRCGEKLLRSPWIGLGAAFLLAIHPYQVFTGHVARFYQQQQFFVLLTAYCFCRGFVTGRAPRHRMATVCAALAATLSQEISALLFVPIGLGWFFGRRRDPGSELRLGVLAGCAAVWIALDYAAFQVLCLTRTEGISPVVQARIEPNFDAPYNFVALLLGYSRLHVVLSAFLVVGLVRAARAKDRSVLALAFLLFSGVALVNLLVTHVSLRYQYAFFPLWVLLGVYGVAAAARALAALSLPPGRLRRVNRWMPSACAFLFITTVVVSWAPWRIRDSYASTLLGDATGAFRFVASQRREGDRIAATEPHTHAALLEVGQVDYDLAVPLLYDFALREGGRLIDRNAGARVLSSLEDLEDVVRRNDRLWIVLNREKLRSRGRNLRWEYPGARIESFIRQNCRLEYETYLWSVFLWDAGAGRYRGFRRGGS